MRRSAWFYATLATALLACAALVIVPELAAETGSRGLALIPRDAAAVLVVDIAKIRTTPLYPSWEQLLRNQPVVQDPAYVEFVRQTGFDYARDLDGLVVGWPTGDKPGIYVIAQGRFDQAKIASYLESRTNPAGSLCAPREYQGYKIFSSSAWFDWRPQAPAATKQGSPTEHVSGVPPEAPAYHHDYLMGSEVNLSAAFLDDHTIVWAAGNIEPVLDCTLGRADSVLASPDFQPYLPELTNSAIAGVAMVPKLRERLSPAPERPMAIHWRHLQILTLFAQVGGESLQVSAEGLFDSVPAAEAARDAFRGLLLLARASLASGNHPAPADLKALREFLDGIQLEQIGENVTLKAQITSQLVEWVANQRGTRSQRRKLTLPAER